jgi:hypothetical protein
MMVDGVVKQLVKPDVAGDERIAGWLLAVGCFREERVCVFALTFEPSSSNFLHRAT